MRTMVWRKRGMPGMLDGDLQRRDAAVRQPEPDSSRRDTGRRCPYIGGDHGVAVVQSLRDAHLVVGWALGVGSDDRVATLERPERNALELEDRIAGEQL